MFEPGAWINYVHLGKTTIGRIGRIERMPADVPKRMREVIDTAIEHGWRVQLRNGIDTGDNRFYQLDMVRDATEDRPRRWLRLSWHTRATGGRTYRFFDGLWNGRGHVNVKQAEALIRGGVA